jgi:DNA-binding CsgD family transcriptional regulator
MKSTVDLVEQALSRWTEAKAMPIDPELLNLLKTGFFGNYQLFTEQIFVIIDHAAAAYHYVSENFSGITGYSLDVMYREGLRFVMPLIHPDDLEAFNTISELLTQKASTLDAAELTNCRLSYDVRMAFADNTWHRMLQHNIPLTLDTSNRIVHALAILTDITPYKTGNYCSYQLAKYSDRERIILLEGVIGNNRQTLPEITKRERQVIELTARGLKESEVAAQMRIGIQTVKTYKKNLFRKTGCKNAAELVRFGVANLLL